MMKHISVTKTIDKDKRIPSTRTIAGSYGSSLHPFKSKSLKRRAPSNVSLGEEKNDSSVTLQSLDEIKVQPELLAFEIWKGEVVRINADSLDIDIRNERVNTVRRVIRVKKRRIEGDVAQAFRGMEVRVVYKRFKTFKFEGEYKEIKQETTQVKLAQPSRIPLEVRKMEFEERYQRYSYMFEDGDK